MTADNWYVRTATGESIGPLSEAHVREMLLRTTDLQGTKVRQGNSAWIDASYVLNRFKELMERGVYLAHQNQTLGPFTTEHANNLIRQHATISKYRIGENGEWKALDSSRTIKAPADKAPAEPQPSPKPKQAVPAPKATPANLGVNLADLRLGTGVPIQRSVEDSSTHFDPYRVWLGLPKGLKHPTYYHILGITQGESSVDVIRSAIEQRRSYILSKRGEGHDGSVQQILSMIEEAAATLLVPEFKHGYDRYIGSHLKEKKKPNRRSYVLPSWMESRVVRTYGEGSGIVGDLLGIVAVLFGAFALMAILSFTLQSQATKSDGPRELTWMEKAADVTSTEGAESTKDAESSGLQDPIKKQDEEADRMAAAKAEAERIAAAKAEEERIAAAKAEAERIAEAKAEAERIATAKVDAERILAEPPFINSINLALKKLPAGKFVMCEGSNSLEVILTRPFYIGVYEVTQEQYQRVMGTNPSSFKGASNPVEEISWDDAVEFCRRLSELPEEKAAGRVYRLPTEAEWEYACRAGTTTKFSFGNDESKLGEYAWFVHSSGSKAHPVGKKKPNAWGLYDMHGNVWECCSDWSGTYPKNAVTDPVGPKDGSRRVLRGGSWGDSARYCRAALRNTGAPSLRTTYTGFRVALSSTEIP